MACLPVVCCHLTFHSFVLLSVRPFSWLVYLLFAAIFLFLFRLFPSSFHNLNKNLHRIYSFEIANCTFTL
jgi:hypothetical protein